MRNLFIFFRGILIRTRQDQHMHFFLTVNKILMILKSTFFLFFYQHSFPPHIIVGVLFPALHVANIYFFIIWYDVLICSGFPKLEIKLC